MTDSIISPLLTIAIPTWNRAAYLRLNLEQLASQLVTLEHLIEILISDNASADESPNVVASFLQKRLQLRYIRNAENIGSDCNIAQCFNEARGQYVLILGDDDVLVDGALSWLVECLSKQEYGVVCMRPYGYENDFRKEYPGGLGGEKIFKDAGAFLAEIGPLVTLISACAINKKLLNKADAREFCGGSLVQVHLVIRAALAAKQSIFVNRYLLACKRNNSGGYDFFRVFVEEFWRILDQYRSFGLSSSAIDALESRMLLGYYPFYLFRQRMTQASDNENVYVMLKTRFGRHCLFRVLLAPILRLPRSLGIAWGAGATIFGRIATGDLRRGVMFAWNRLVQMVRK